MGHFFFLRSVKVVLFDKKRKCFHPIHCWDDSALPLVWCPEFSWTVPEINLLFFFFISLCRLWVLTVHNLIVISEGSVPFSELLHHLCFLCWNSTNGNCTLCSIICIPALSFIFFLLKRFPIYSFELWVLRYQFVYFHGFWLKPKDFYKIKNSANLGQVN